MGSNLCTSRHSKRKLTEEGELMVVHKSTAPSVFFEFLKPECLKVGSGEKHKRRTKLLRSEERMLEDEEEEEEEEDFASSMTLSECLSLEEHLLSPSPHEGKLSPRVYPEKSALSYSLLEKAESKGLSSDGGMVVVAGGDEGERERLTPRSRSTAGEKKKVSFRWPEADVVVFDRSDDCDGREA